MKVGGPVKPKGKIDVGPRRPTCTCSPVSDDTRYDSTNGNVAVVRILPGKEIDLDRCFQLIALPSLGGTAFVTAPHRDGMDRRTRLDHPAYSRRPGIPLCQSAPCDWRPSFRRLSACRDTPRRPRRALPHPFPNARCESRRDRVSVAIQARDPTIGSDWMLVLAMNLSEPTRLREYAQNRRRTGPCAA